MKQKYNASSYKLFVKIIYSDEDNKNTDEREDQDEIKDIYDDVYAFCKNLLEFPTAIEFKTI